MKKKFCPIVKGNCMREDCVLWVKDMGKVTDLKVRKLKDTSNCAFQKMGEESAMNIWNETERIINEH